MGVSASEGSGKHWMSSSFGVCLHGSCYAWDAGVVFLLTGSFLDSMKRRSSLNMGLFRRWRCGMRNESARNGMRNRLWEWGDYELKERVIRGHRVQEQKVWIDSGRRYWGWSQREENMVGCASPKRLSESWIDWCSVLGDLEQFCLRKRVGPDDLSRFLLSWWFWEDISHCLDSLEMSFLNGKFICWIQFNCCICILYIHLPWGNSYILNKSNKSINMIRFILIIT